MVERETSQAQNGAPTLLPIFSVCHGSASDNIHLGMLENKKGYLSIAFRVLTLSFIGDESAGERLAFRHEFVPKEMMLPLLAETTC
jgi:hypothetical protein